MSKRIVLFMGHYGSGKTFCAVNYAIELAKENKRVSIYDLDIVNPYFRTVDAKERLDKFGVELIVSPYAETNVDIPAMNSASYKMVDDLNSFAVVDVGGDDRGALALGRFREKIIAENDYDALLVVNAFRPETRTVEGVLEIKAEIERSGRLAFTGIVNSSNLGIDTTAETVLSGIDFCKKVSEKTGLPLKFSAVREDLVEKVKIKADKNQKIMPIRPIKYGQWL